MSLDESMVSVNPRTFQALSGCCSPKALSRILCNLPKVSPSEKLEHDTSKS